MIRIMTSFLVLFISVIPYATPSNVDLITQINRAHYLLPQHQAIGFAGTFQNPEILRLAEHLSQSNDRQHSDLGRSLSRVHLKIRVTSDEGFRMFTTPIPDIQDHLIQRGISDAIHKSERSLASILDTWMQFVLTPVLPLKNREGERIHYEITENATQWRIEQADQGLKTVLIVDKKGYRVVRILSYVEGQKIVIEPQFKPTSEGWLFEGYTSTMDDGRAILNVRIQHRQIEKKQIPESVELAVVLNGRQINREQYLLDSEVVAN